MNNELETGDASQKEDGTTPLISIIVPAYDAEKTVEKCVQSALRQDYPNIEVIVVNDGSTDSTASLIDVLACVDSRVRTVHQENRGLSGARNTGLDVANGDYIFFLDADDHISRNEIAALFAVMEKDNADIAVGGYVYKTPSGAETGVVKATACMTDERGYWLLAYGTSSEDYGEFVVSCGKLFKRSLFCEERFDEGKLHEDEFIIHRLISHCKRVAVVDVAEYNYIQSSSSIMHTRGIKAYLDTTEALIARCEYFMRCGWPDLAWRALRGARGGLADYLTLRTEDDLQRCKTLRTRWLELYRSLVRVGGSTPLLFIGCSLFAASPPLFVWLKERKNSQ